MDVLHGAWDAVAGGLGLMSALASMLAFAIFVGQAERTPSAPGRGRRSG